MANFPRFAASAATAIGLALAYGTASATDLDATFDTYHLSYKEQDVEAEGVTVEDESVFSVSQSETSLIVKSGASDRIDIEAETWSGGYMKQDVEATDVEVRNGSVFSVHQGSLGLITY